MTRERNRPSSGVRRFSIASLYDCTNSGDPGSPQRRGPPRQAYQYVRPLAVTFAIPLRLILTMARTELLQLTVEVVLHRRLGPTRNDNDPAVLGDFNPRNIHTSGDRGPNGSGHVLLPECGGSARHGSGSLGISHCCECAARADSAPWRLEVAEAVAYRAERRLVVPAVDGDGAGRALDRVGRLGERRAAPLPYPPQRSGAGTALLPLYRREQCSAANRCRLLGEQCRSGAGSGAAHLRSSLVHPLEGSRRSRCGSCLRGTAGPCCRPARACRYGRPWPPAPRQSARARSYWR